MQYLLRVDSVPMVTYYKEDATHFVDSLVEVTIIVRLLNMMFPADKWEYEKIENYYLIFTVDSIFKLEKHEQH